MRRGPLGTQALNAALREAFNPDRGQPSFGRFRVGDVVLHTRNNYDLQAFNGELGTITAIHRGPCASYRGKDHDPWEDPEDGTLLDPQAMQEANGNDPHIHVRFEDREVVYADPEDWEDLVPAWCLTVHKSQGGQFPAVCLVATTSHFIMLRRNLIYTGITRAEKHLLFLTHPRALRQVSRSQTQDRRLTWLSALLRGEPDNNEYDLPTDQGMEQEEYDPSLSDFLDLQRTSQVTASTDHDQPAQASPDPKRRQPTPTKGKANFASADPAEDADFDPFLGASYSPSTEPGKSDFRPLSGPTKGHSSVDSLPQDSNCSRSSHSPSGPAKPALAKSTKRVKQLDRPESASSPTSTQATQKTSKPEAEPEADWAEFMDWV